MNAEVLDPESGIINTTPERADTWNNPRSPEVLAAFVTARLARLPQGDPDLE